MKKRNYQVFMLGLLLLGVLMLASCATTKTSVTTQALADTIMGSTVVQAPPEKIFNYLSVPKNMLSYIPWTRSVINVQGQGLGATFSVTAEEGGEMVTGNIAITDYVPNSRLEFAVGMVQGGITETWIFMLAPAPAGGAKITLVIQYARETPAMTAEQKKDFYKNVHGALELVLKTLKTNMEK